MKITIKFILSVGLTLLLGCKIFTPDNSSDDKLPVLNGNNFILKVNRICEHPGVQCPHDELQEDDYQEASNDTTYAIHFSDNGEIVNINNNAITGERVSQSTESRKYDLQQGTFAGGRFVVWTSENGYEAELTIYGSGVPIIISERGDLVPDD